MTISATSITVTATASTSEPNGSPTRCATTSAWWTAASTATARNAPAIDEDDRPRLAAPGRGGQDRREHGDDGGPARRAQTSRSGWQPARAAAALLVVGAGAALEPVGARAGGEHVVAVVAEPVVAVAAVERVRARAALSRSSPASPKIASSPPPPSIVSLPPSPQITSSRGVPVRRSSPSCR